MKADRPNKRKRRIFPAILLALLCVAAVELLACRHFDPQLYKQITTPVRKAAHSAAQATVAGLDAFGGGVVAFGDSVADFFQTKADAAAKTLAKLDRPDSQETSEPALGSGDLDSDPSFTELTSQDGVQILTGGFTNTVYYNQTDPLWASSSYGTDSISGYACGPTAMAIVISSLTDTRVNPVDLSQWAVDNGHWAARCGSYLSIVQGAAQAYGLEAQAYSLDLAENISVELATGHMFVALMAPGHFTSSGHFIVLRGIAADGSILVADPSSTERSLTLWDKQLILDELSRSRSYGAPLWLISAP